MERVEPLWNLWDMVRMERWVSSYCRGRLSWLDNTSWKRDRWRLRSWRDWRLLISLLKRFMCKKSCDRWQQRRLKPGHKNQSLLFLRSTPKITQLNMLYTKNQPSGHILQNLRSPLADSQVRSFKDTRRRNSNSNNSQQPSKYTRGSTWTVWWGSRPCLSMIKVANNTTRAKHGLSLPQSLIPTPKSSRKLYSPSLSF